MADPAWTDVVFQIQPAGPNGATTFTDQSSYGHSLSRTSSTASLPVQSTTHVKFATASVRFDTFVGFQRLAATVTEFATSANGTFEGWFWFDTLAGGVQTIFSGVFTVSVDTDGSVSMAGSSLLTTAASVIAAGSMVYIRCVQVGTAGTIYVGGVSKATGTVGAIQSGSRGGCILGGSNNATTGNFWYCAGARYSRTAFETTAFTPPTGPFPAILSSTGSASGTGAGTGVGRATVVAAGASAGTGAGTGVGKSTAAAAGASAATATASGVGASTAAATGASAGTSTASATGASTAAAAGSADAVATAAAVGSSTFTASGDAQGTAQAFGIAVGISVATGAAAGVGAANGAAIPQMVGLSTGIGAAFGVGSNTALSVGLALAFGGAFGRGTLDAVFPRTLYAVHFGTPIGPNNDAVKVTRTINAARLGYPVAYWIDIS